MTIVWFIIWLIANNTGGSEPLELDPVNIWTGSLILAIALDLNRPRPELSRGRNGPGVSHTLDDQAAMPFDDLGAEGRTGSSEAAGDPPGFLRIGQARAAEVERERHRFDAHHVAIVDRHQEQQAPVVAQHGMGGVVIDEVTQVVEHGIVDPVEHVGGVAGDEGRSGLEQHRRGRTHVVDRHGNHVRTPVGCHDDDIGAQVGDALEQPARAASPQVSVGNTGIGAGPRDTR